MTLPSNKLTLRSASELDLPQNTETNLLFQQASERYRSALAIVLSKGVGVTCGSASETDLPQEAMAFSAFHGSILEQEEQSSIVNEVKRLQFLIQKWINASQMTTEGPTVECSTASLPVQANVDVGIKLVNTLHKIFCNEDNWDGYGTPKISDALKKKCFEILDTICQTGFILPYAFPVVSGGLQFEWKIGNKELEIEFSEESISALRTETVNGGRKRYTEDEKIIMDEIPELIAWLKNS